MLIATRSLLLLLILIPLLGLSQQPKLTFYVSVNGSDRNPGTKQQPFATLQKARDHIRLLKRNNKTSGTGATILIRGGVYRLTEAFQLTGQDSGNETTPYTIAAYTGEKVTITSAVQLSPEKWKPLEQATFSRLHPKVGGEKLVVYDISSLPFQRLRQFAPMNSFMDGWPSIDVYANNKRQPIAQWPNENEGVRRQNDAGWATYNGAKDQASFYYAAGGKPEDGDTTNELDGDGTNRSARWRNALQSGHEIWLKGFWRVPWGPITSKVKSMDHNSIQLIDVPDRGMGSKYSAIVSHDPLWRVGSGKEKWMLVNALEEIDQPGEWALDIKDQKVYYYPPAAVQKLSVEIAADTFPVISVHNSRFIHISGLHINGSLAQGISVEGSEHIKIAGCNIYNVGDAGILVRGGHHNVIQSNTIYETGAAGIVMENQGDRKCLMASSSLIHNNHLHHIGVMAFSESIQLANSVGIKIANNLLHDLPKSAIRTDLINNCLFQYNEIHNIALKESDNGAFYNYGGWSTYGNIFRYNFIHHVHRSNGLYCDDGDSGDLFYGNIIHDAIEAIKFGGGHDNIARNNLIVNSKSQNVDDRGINRDYRLNTPYEKGVLDMKPFEEPWRSYGAQLQKDYGIKHTLWNDILSADWHPEFPNGSKMIHNVTVNSGPFVKPEHGDVVVEGNLAIGKLSDAGFYDYAQMDLRSDNPEILSKVPDLNQFFKKIGLHIDAYRKVIPTRKETGGLENRMKAGDLANEDQFIEKKL